MQGRNPLVHLQSHKHLIEGRMAFRTRSQSHPVQGRSHIPYKLQSHPVQVRSHIPCKVDVKLNLYRLPDHEGCLCPYTDKGANQWDSWVSLGIPQEVFGLPGIPVNDPRADPKQNCTNGPRGDPKRQCPWWPAGVPEITKPFLTPPPLENASDLCKIFREGRRR